MRLVAEATGAKLSRILCAFLQVEVLPQAERLYADALEHRGPIDR